MCTIYSHLWASRHTAARAPIPPRFQSLVQKPPRHDLPARRAAPSAEAP